MNKKYIICLICLSISLLFGGIVAHGEEPTSPVAQGACGVDLSWSLDMDGELHIQGTGEMTNFFGGEEYPWYQYRNQIKKVVFEEGCESVGRHSFERIPALTEVVFSETVRTIGASAFEECVRLKPPVLSQQIKSIERAAFKGCSSIDEISLPETLEIIASNCFESCQSLKKIVIPPYVTKVKEEAFHNCVSLESVEFPEGLKELSEACFFNCISLKTVDLKQVEQIGDQAFYNCGLDSVIMPNSVKKIGNQAFGYGTGGKDSNFMIIGERGATSYAYAVTNSLFFYDVDRYEANLKLQNQTGGVYVKWNPAANVEFYQVYRKVGDQMVFMGETTEPYFIDEEVSNGVKYTYEIYAVFTCEIRENIATSTIIYVSAVTGFSGSNVKSRSIKTKWNKNPKCSGYIVQYSKYSSFSSSKTKTISSAATRKKVIRKLSKGKKYYIRIRAYKTSGSERYYSAWKKYGKAIKIKR